MSRLLLALLLALTGLAAEAHETTRSYLLLDREGPELTGRLRLAFRDVEVVAWMDQDLDGRITWAEAKARLPEAASYAEARIALDAGGPCPIRPGEAGVSSGGGIDYLDLAFAATCPGAETPLKVSTTLFQEIDPSHRLFLTLDDPSGETSTVLGSGEVPTEVAPAQGIGTAFVTYLREGVGHLLAGYDHLVFLMALILPAAVARGALGPRIWGVVAAVTGFTIAHALTLTAAVSNILRPPSALIEALIAFSIIVTAVDNVRPFIPGPRAALAAFFGTIHGFGFATALGGLALSGGGFAVALLGFNLGIEAAQVGVVLLAVPLLALAARAIGGRPILWAGSAAAIVVAGYWLLQRLPAALGLA